MNSRADIARRLTEPGIIAVVRARRTDQVPPLAEALVAGGVLAVEVTFSTPDACAAIQATTARLGDRALVGVGTVLDEAQCRAALAASAQFIVSPIGRRELVPIAHAAGKPVMLGAYTPTEAQLVHETGADFVKLFPADTLGPAFIKGLRAPLPHLKIVPTGGVDLNTLAAFVQAGCVAVGVGSSLVSADILARDDWPALTALARQFVAAMAAARRAKR
jgi:2-dehydro-3-deoxyphosphogluconate aldolase/(4S)-4-hydroxy-2-oxoglutarate aldolase